MYSAPAYNSKKTVQRVSVVTPLSLLYRHLQCRAVVSVWLSKNNKMRIEGRIIGFDGDNFDLVLEEAVEVYLKKEVRKNIGKIVLRGDNVSLIQSKDGEASNSACQVVVD